jgi:TonB family protein
VIAQLTPAQLDSPLREWVTLPVDADYLQCVGNPTVYETPAAPAVVGVGGVVAPKKTHDVRPIYPQAMLAARIQGIVAITATVARTGCVTEARVTRSAKPQLDFAALHAVYGWRFTPAVLNGQPVPALMTITVNFSLQ